MMIINSFILCFILGYISAYLVRHYANKKFVDEVDDITDAITEFKELDRKDRGEFITMHNRKERIDSAKTLDDLIDDNE